jgi:hypothetical protein
MCNMAARSVGNCQVGNLRSIISLMAYVGVQRVVSLDDIVISLRLSLSSLYAVRDPLRFDDIYLNLGFD